MFDLLLQMKKVEIKIVITDEVGITSKPPKTKNKNPTIEFSQPDGKSNKKKVFILKVPTVEEQQAWMECIKDTRDKVSFFFCLLCCNLTHSKNPHSWRDSTNRAKSILGCLEIACTGCRRTLLLLMMSLDFHSLCSRLSCF